MARFSLKLAEALDDVDGVDTALATRSAQLRRRPPRRALLSALLVACLLAAAAIGLLWSGQSDRTRATAAVPVAKVATGHSTAKPLPPLRSRPKVVIAVRPGETPPVGVPTATPGVSAPRPQSDAEIRNELAAFRQHLQGVGARTGPVAKVLRDGTAVAPRDAPAQVLSVIAAANAIASTPYKWGGGHGAWSDTGYDCSGSASFALAGARLLESPLTSGLFMKYGAAGPGRWITIYANDGHMFMVVAGLRYDTSGANGGTRWQGAPRSTAGFAVRHPPGF